MLGKSLSQLTQFVIFSICHRYFSRKNVAHILKHQIVSLAVRISKHSYVGSLVNRSTIVFDNNDQVFCRKYFSLVICFQYYIGSQIVQIYYNCYNLQQNCSNFLTNKSSTIIFYINSVSARFFYQIL